MPGAAIVAGAAVGLIRYAGKLNSFAVSASRGDAAVFNVNFCDNAKLYASSIVVTSSMLL
jgi:hypothetical protein